MTKFLIVRLGSLGDVVHGIPVAAALRNTFPSAHVDWLVSPQYMELLNLVEALDRRIPVDTRRMTGGEGLFSTLGDIRRARYDAVIDMQGLLKSAVLARAAGARKTVGFPRSHLREPLAGLFYSDTPDPGQETHVVHKNLSLLGALGVTDRQVRFPVAVPRVAEVEALARRFGTSGYAIVNAGAAWPNKRWPPDRFGSLAASIDREFGLKSLVLWGPGEESLAAAVVEASGGAAEVAPPTGIGDLVALARSARLMISGDTGPLHIAGAVGTPLVALFGPTLPARNGPWAARDVTLSRVHACSCVYERRCRNAVRCIDDISVGEVLAAVRQRLGGASV